MTELRLCFVSVEHGDRTTAAPPRMPPAAAGPTDANLRNALLAAAYVEGSYRVHAFRDPQRPDSDHKRISVTVDI